MMERSGGGGISLEALVARLQDRYDPDIADKLLNVYLSGSRVYGTYSPESDWDYIAVTMEPTRNLRAQDGTHGEGAVEESKFVPDLPFPPSMDLSIYEDQELGIDVTFMTLQHFTILVREHRMSVLECLYLPPQYVLLESVPFENQVDADALRKAISWSASLKFDHAKRRYGEGRVYKAKKLVWLSLRYFVFARQIVEKGAIYDYSAANSYWDDIKDFEPTSWEELSQRYKQAYKLEENKFKTARKYHDFYTTEEIYNATSSALKKHPFRSPNSSASASSPSPSPSPSPLVTINLLRENGLEWIQTRFGIISCRHSNYPNLIQLSTTIFPPSYISSSIEEADGKETEEAKREWQETMKIVRNECNGLIVDEESEVSPFAVVAFPYEKFEIDLQVDNKLLKSELAFPSPVASSSKEDLQQCARVYERLDGCLCILYYFAEKWHVASQCIVDASEEVCWKDLDGERPPRQSLAQKFWSIWANLGYSLPSLEDRCCCFMFELVTPALRKVSFYPEEKLILHGARNVLTLQELDPVVVAERNGWECVRRIDGICSLEAILSATEALNPLQQIGFLVATTPSGSSNLSFRRVQFFSSQYIAVSASIGFQNKGFGPFNMGAENFDWDCLLELIRTNKLSLFLSHYPRWKPLTDDLIAKYNAWCSFLDAKWQQVQNSKEAEEGGHTVERPKAEAKQLAQRINGLAFCSPSAAKDINKIYRTLFFEHAKQPTTASNMLATLSKKVFLRLYKAFVEEHYQ
ncbi:Npa1 domain-containing protein [Balamuthia mandrillaris]